MQAYKIRAFPNKTTEKYLLNTMNYCRILYNNAIIERRNAYKHSKKSLSYFDQSYHVKTIREENEEYRTMDARLLYTTLKRVQTTYQNFFDTQKRLRKLGLPLTEKGKLIGYPRLKKRIDFKTIVFENTGWQLNQDTQKLLFIHRKTILGKMRLLLYRPIEGKIKTVSVSLSKTNKWWLIFTCENNNPETVQNQKFVGLDFGVKSLVADSDGKIWKNPRFLDLFKKKIAYWEQKMEKTNKKDPEYKKHNRSLNRVNEKLTNKRMALAREIALYYATNYDCICLEDVNVTEISARKTTKELKESDLTRGADQKKNKQILNASIGNIRIAIRTAAKKRGKITIDVEAAFTSQLCSSCGSRNSAMSDVSEREFICPSCGLRMDRDINAAKNILRRGLFSRKTDEK